MFICYFTHKPRFGNPSLGNKSLMKVERCCFVFDFFSVGLWMKTSGSDLKAHRVLLFHVFIQDSIDLFLGNYAVEEADMNTPLHEPKDWKFLTVRTRLSCEPRKTQHTEHTEPLVLDVFGICFQLQNTTDLYLLSTAVFYHIAAS